MRGSLRPLVGKNGEEAAPPPMIPPRSDASSELEKPEVDCRCESFRLSRLLPAFLM